MQSFNHICWESSEKRDLLVFDDAGSDEIIRCIPSDLVTYVLPIGSSFVAVRKTFFFLLFVFFFMRCRSISVAMAAALVVVWDVKVVITFVDNSNAMGILKRLIPTRTMISVQNGTRWDLSSPEFKGVSHDIYCSFGSIEKDIFSESNCVFNEFYPIGSLRLGLIAEANEDNIKCDLCFISQYDAVNSDADGWMGESVIPIYREVGGELAKLASDFSKSRGLSLKVALRSGVSDPFHEEECAFYRNWMGEYGELIPNMDGSSYRLVFASKLVITMSSTLGYEALGVGRKVLFAKGVFALESLVLKGAWSVNYSVSSLPELMRLEHLTQSDFSFRSSSLLDMSGEDYLSYSAESRSYYMNFDPKKMPHQFIKEMLIAKC